MINNNTEILQNNIETTDSKKDIEKISYNGYIMDDEEILVDIPEKERELIVEAKDDEELKEDKGVLDRDIEQVMKMVKRELGKGIPVKIKDGKVHLSEDVIEQIAKKTGVVTDMYAKRYVLKRLNFLLSSAYSLARGIQVQKGVKIFELPPNMDAIKFMVDLLKDDKALRQESTGKILKLSEILKQRANGNKKITVRERTIEQIDK